MNCPLDNTQLSITERQGVEIDYCPKCRGVWLDRGELDKIIEKSESVHQSSSAPQHLREYNPETQHNPKYYRPEFENQKHPKKKRESFLGDLFDF